MIMWRYRRPVLARGSGLRDSSRTILRRKLFPAYVRFLPSSEVFSSALRATLVHSARTRPWPALWPQSEVFFFPKAAGRTVFFVHVISETAWSFRVTSRRGHRERGGYSEYSCQGNADGEGADQVPEE